MGPAASAAHPPGRLARPRRTAAHHRGHRHPPGRRKVAQRRGQQAALAVVVAHRRYRNGCRPLLAVLPSPLRHRAHIPPVQADFRLDQAPASQLGSGRPVDLDRNRCLCPAPARSPAGHRPPQALGEAGRAEQAHARPRAQRVQEPASEDRLPGWCTETVPPRPRQAARLEEPPPGHPTRRGQSPRHRRGVQPSHPPQSRHQTPARHLKALGEDRTGE